MRETELNYSNLLQQYEHETAMKQQNIDTLEKNLKETKENLISLQNQSNSALEQYIQNFN